MVSATARASAALLRPVSVPGTKGTLAFFMFWRALVLEPIISMDSGEGPMKTIPASRQARAKLCVLGEESIAGVDGLGAGAAGGLENLGNVEIGLRRLGGTEVLAEIGLAHMQSAPIDIGIDRDRFDAHFAAGTDDANRDLAAVGDKDSFEHGDELPSACGVGRKPGFYQNPETRGTRKMVRRRPGGADPVRSAGAAGGESSYLGADSGLRRARVSWTCSTRMRKRSMVAVMILDFSTRPRWVASCLVATAL